MRVYCKYSVSGDFPRFPWHFYNVFKKILLWFQFQKVLLPGSKLYVVLMSNGCVYTKSIFFIPWGNVCTISYKYKEIKNSKLITQKFMYCVGNWHASIL